MKEATRHYFARQLLRSESVQIRPSQPFTLSSGRLSPVYVDCRRLLAFPIPRRKIIKGFAGVVGGHIMGLGKFDVIAGGETAGIPFATLLAEKVSKPMIYVRKEPKGYGKSSQIGGILQPGQRVLLVEDLVTDGGSKLNFKHGIESSGGIVQHCLCVFEYFSEEAGLHRARDTLQQNAIALHALVNWDDVLSVARAEKSFTNEEITEVLKFLSELAR
jgi:orotate phosphoribosyltransferase